MKTGDCTCCGSAGRGDEDDSEEAKVFGEKANYWEIHNEITDKYDEDLIERMNTSLDNLLIFVSSSPTRKR